MSQWLTTYKIFLQTKGRLFPQYSWTTSQKKIENRTIWPKGSSVAVENRTFSSHPSLIEIPSPVLTPSTTSPLPNPSTLPKHAQVHILPLGHPSSSAATPDPLRVVPWPHWLSNTNSLPISTCTTWCARRTSPSTTKSSSGGAPLINSGKRAGPSTWASRWRRRKGDRSSITTFP